MLLVSLMPINHLLIFHKLLEMKAEYKPWDPFRSASREHCEFLGL